MPIRSFSLVVGLLCAALGVLGYVPSLLEASAIPEYMARVGETAGFGNLFGLFPANYVENISYMVIGLTGLSAFLLNDERYARLYAQTVTFWFALLGILGLIPVANTLFGIMPIYGGDVALHLITAAIAGYFGFFIKSGELLPAESQQIDKLENKSY